MRRNFGFAAVVSVALAMVFMGCQPPHEHSWDAGTVTLEPTCTEKGIKTFKCTDVDCGEERTEAIAAKGHSYSYVGKDSDNHMKECSVCKENLKEAHNFIYKGNSWQACGCREKKAVSLDTLGTYDSVKMTFGVYPQTKKAKSVKVDEKVKNEEITGADYYLGNDGAWYAKCVENKNTKNSNTFYYSDGSTVAEKEANKETYFKVEPIEWVYLAETKCLHAKKILTANIQWHESSIEYANSNIRSWLNGTFYNSAFTENQKNKIKTTTVDNSVESTGFSSNSNACEDTDDKIYLLSFREATTEGNGFTAYNVFGGGNSRIRFPTDYALANYCDMSTTNKLCGGRWLLRSPTTNPEMVCTVHHDGAADNACLIYKEHDGGIAPALSLYSYK